MSMDEQFEQMGYFHRALIHFNEQLRASMADLERQHEHVSPHWNDAMRGRYDREWQPLEEQMKRYSSVEGPRYVDFLSDKLRALERYLHGD